MIYDKENLEVIELGILNILEKVKNEEKKILIKYNENDIDNNNFLNNLKNLIENFNKNNNNLHQITFLENQELLRERIKHLNKYNILFDLSLKIPKEYKINLEYLSQEFNYEFKNHLFNFFEKENIFDLLKYKLENIEKINIRNFSSKFFYSDFLTKKQYPLNPKILEILNDNNLPKNDIKNIRDFNNNKITLNEKRNFLEKKYGEKFNIDLLIDLIKANPKLRYNLYRNFLKKNSGKLLGDKDLKITMLTGEEGYIDFILTPPLKQREE